jgi:hypothetical protein
MAGQGVSMIYTICKNMNDDIVILAKDGSYLGFKQVLMDKNGDARTFKDIDEAVNHVEVELYRENMFKIKEELLQLGE